MSTVSLKQYELAIYAARAQSSRHGAYAAEVTKLVAYAKAQASCGDCPADLDKLSRHVGIVATREVPLAMRGRLLREPRGFTVEVNCELPPFQRRFVRAHEIAHLLVEKDLLVKAPQRSQRTNVPGALAYALVEKLCDLGAAEILLPASYLRTRLRRRPPDLTLVRQVADEGQLSIDFVAARICDAAVWSCRFLWWQEHHAQFVVTMSVPDCTKDTLASVRLSDEANSLVRKAMYSNEVVAGTESIEFWEGTQRYKAQCVRVAENEAVSLLIYR